MDSSDPELVVHASEPELVVHASEPELVVHASESELVVHASESELVVQAYPGNHFEQIDGVAVAIVGSAATRSNERRHLGLLLRPEDGRLSLIHLGWHYCLLKDTDPPDHYCWLNLHWMDTINAEFLADWCIEVAELNSDQIPYSILYSGEPYFTQDCKVIGGPPGFGLTCATFVLDVFHNTGFELLDIKSWTSRPEDKAWAEFIMSMLQEHNDVSTEHLQAQREMVDSFSRFRPEEVASAAALYTGKPMVMLEAVSLGQNIVRQMTALGRD